MNLAPMKNFLNWFESRLHLAELITPSATHSVPTSAKWWYVFGSMTLTLFILQITTGICLSLAYVPSGSQAWESLMYMNYELYMGWFLRAMHVWGSHLMLTFMTIHMLQVFLYGAFKFPRELTWIVGLGLFLCTLGMAFTGQVLRWDQDAYWGLSVGMAMAGRVPWIGPELVHFVLGGAVIGSEALSRFFALHVFVLPGALFGLIGLHLLLVIKCGINETPTPGYHVNKKTYFETYEREVKKRGMPFFPNAAARDMIAVSITLFLVILFAALFGPSDGHARSDAHRHVTRARLLVHVDLRRAGAAASVHGDLPHHRLPGAGRSGADTAAIHLRQRREALEATPLLRAGHHLPDAHAWFPHLSGLHSPMVTGDECLEWNPHTHFVCPEQNPTAAPGRHGDPEQAVPQLPRPAGTWRPSRTGTG